MLLYTGSGLFRNLRSVGRNFIPKLRYVGIFENYLLLGLLSPPIKTSLIDGLARTSVTVADVAFADELLALFIEIG